MIRKLDEIENDIDNRQLVLQSHLHSIESTLDPVTIVLLYEVITRTSEVGRAADSVGRRLELLLSHRVVDAEPRVRDAVVQPAGHLPVVQPQANPDPAQRVRIQWSFLFPRAPSRNHFSFQPAMVSPRRLSSPPKPSFPSFRASLC